jgi:methionyl-tRNA formyltransferase
MKTRKELSIVFMGTPDFAVGILDTILQNQFSVKAVVTSPDKPAGRGLQMNESAVKKYALTHNLKILQPERLKDENFLNELKSIDADLFVVVAFRMLPEQVWRMPRFGTINLHASLLPQYRGAAPINWALINGEEETGVTTFFIEKEIDTGKIIEQATLKIGQDENVGDLYLRLMELGAQTVVSTLDKIKDETFNVISQEKMIDGELKEAPKIFKEHCEISWDMTVKNVHNFIRGLSPYPAAWTSLLNKTTGEKKQFKIFSGHITAIPSLNNGSLMENNDGIHIPCKDFYFAVQELQIEGKRRMNFKEFLAGNKIDCWELIKNDINPS